MSTKTRKKRMSGRRGHPKVHLDFQFILSQQEFSQALIAPCKSSRYYILFAFIS